MSIIEVKKLLFSFFIFSIVKCITPELFCSEKIPDETDLCGFWWGYTNKGEVLPSEMIRNDFNVTNGLEQHVKLPVLFLKGNFKNVFHTIDFCDKSRRGQIWNLNGTVVNNFDVNVIKKCKIECSFWKKEKHDSCSRYIGVKMGDKLYRPIVIKKTDSLLYLSLYNVSGKNELELNFQKNLMLLSKENNIFSLLYQNELFFVVYFTQNNGTLCKRYLQIKSTKEKYEIYNLKNWKTVKNEEILINGNEGYLIGPIKQNIMINLKTKNCTKKEKETDFIYMKKKKIKKKKIFKDCSLHLQKVCLKKKNHQISLSNCHKKINKCGMCGYPDSYCIESNNYCKSCSLSGSLSIPVCHIDTYYTKDHKRVVKIKVEDRTLNNTENYSSQQYKMYFGNMKKKKKKCLDINSNWDRYKDSNKIVIQKTLSVKKLEECISDDNEFFKKHVNGILYIVKQNNFTKHISPCRFSFCYNVKDVSVTHTQIHEQKCVYVGKIIRSKWKTCPNCLKYKMTIFVNANDNKKTIYRWLFNKVVSEVDCVKNQIDFNVKLSKKQPCDSNIHKHLCGQNWDVVIHFKKPNNLFKKFFFKIFFYVEKLKVINNEWVRVEKPIVFDIKINNFNIPSKGPKITKKYERKTTFLKGPFLKPYDLNSTSLYHTTKSYYTLKMCEENCEDKEIKIDRIIIKYNYPYYSEKKKREYIIWDQKNKFKGGIWKTKIETYDQLRNRNNDFKKKTNKKKSICYKKMLWISFVPYLVAKKEMPESVELIVESHLENCDNIKKIIHKNHKNMFPDVYNENENIITPVHYGYNRRRGFHHVNVRSSFISCRSDLYSKACYECTEESGRIPIGFCVNRNDFFGDVYHIALIFLMILYFVLYLHLIHCCRKHIRHKKHEDNSINLIKVKNV